MRKRFLLPTVLLLCCLCFSAGAERIEYTHPETGYRAVLEDEIDLLTEQEEAAVLEIMKEITEHTNAAFWSVKSASSQSQAKQNAESYHIRLFGSRVNGIVFMIDMRVRYMFLDTEGWIQGVIPKSTAEIITNNVRSPMSAGRYGEAVESVFGQVRAKIKGERIAEPMRYLSAVSIGIMGGLLFALLLTARKRQSVNPVYSKETAVASAVVSAAGVGTIGTLVLAGEPTVKRIHSPQSDSSSSCSSCGGGSSCSSCGGGSSCSSCGGGSSF